MVKLPQASLFSGGKNRAKNLTLVHLSFTLVHLFFTPAFQSGTWMLYGLLLVLHGATLVLAFILYIDHVITITQAFFLWVLHGDILI